MITRHWKITDASGNMSTCDQTLTLERATLDDVILPPNYDGLSGNMALNCENRCGDAAELADDSFCGPSGLVVCP